MKPDPDQKKNFSREKWLEIAFETMAGKCVSKFSLDSLLKTMPVTKGSFYAHFKNRSDFLVALVEYWDRHATRIVVDALEAMPEDTSPQDRLWELMCEVHDLGHNSHELLIRSLTMEFPEITEAVRVVDNRRLATVGGLFEAMGFKGDELEMRTRTFVTSMSQEGNIISDISPDAYDRQQRMRWEFFIRP